MEKIKVGVIGMGLIGAFHLDSLRRIGSIELVAVADVDSALAVSKANAYGINKCFDNPDKLIEDPEIKVIHNCTPNNLHTQINEKIIKSGKHLLSEKPLAMNSKESAYLLELLHTYPHIVAGVNFNYRMNPLVQDIKNRIANGEIGKINLVHGSYLQDWLLFDTDYNWRVESEIAGPSRCVADIGVHWIDTAQTMTASKIIEVCADVKTVIPIRKKPKQQIAAFSVSETQDYEERTIDTEDYAGVLVKFDNGSSGVFHCSEISAGRKCFLNVEVNGSKASYYWNQENPDWMWKGNRDSNNEQVMRNPNLITAEAKKYTYLPAGHPEGWNDAFRNNFQSFYSFIEQGKNLKNHKSDFATFEEAHYIMRITEAIMKSGKERRWVRVDEI